MWGKYPKIFSVDILAQSMAAEDVFVCERNFFPKWIYYQNAPEAGI